MDALILVLLVLVVIAVLGGVWVSGWLWLILLVALIVFLLRGFSGRRAP